MKSRGVFYEKHFNNPRKRIHQKHRADSMCALKKHFISPSFPKPCCSSGRCSSVSCSPCPVSPSRNQVGQCAFGALGTMIAAKRLKQTMSQFRNSKICKTTRCGSYTVWRTIACWIAGNQWMLLKSLFLHQTRPQLHRSGSVLEQSGRHQFLGTHAWRAKSEHHVTMWGIVGFSRAKFCSLSPPTAKKKRGIVDKISTSGNTSRGMEEVERINLLQPPVVGIQIAVFGWHTFRPCKVTVFETKRNKNHTRRIRRSNWFKIHREQSTKTPPPVRVDLLCWLWLVWEQTLAFETSKRI